MSALVWLIIIVLGVPLACVAAIWLVALVITLKFALDVVQEPKP